MGRRRGSSPVLTEPMQVFSMFRAWYSLANRLSWVPSWKRSEREHRIPPHLPIHLSTRMNSACAELY